MFSDQRVTKFAYPWCSASSATTTRCTCNNRVEFQTACVMLICFFNKRVFRAVWLSSSRVTRICCLISEKRFVRIRQSLVRNFVRERSLIIGGGGGGKISQRRAQTLGPKPPSNIEVKKSWPSTQHQPKQL